MDPARSDGAIRRSVAGPRERPAPPSTHRRRRYSARRHRARNRRGDDDAAAVRGGDWRGLRERQPGLRSARAPADEPVRRRSEEHTSELQSLMRISYAVFCLKNKNTPISQTQKYTIYPTMEGDHSV